MKHEDIREAEYWQSVALVLAGQVCRHGRANGVGNWSDRPFCGDCETEDYYAALAEEEEVCCALCDGLGHGQPGYGPCPRYEVDHDLAYEVEEEEKRAELLRGPIPPDDIPF
jgi:hypothetical protein